MKQGRVEKGPKNSDIIYGCPLIGDFESTKYLLIKWDYKNLLEKTALERNSYYRRTPVSYLWFHWALSIRNHTKWRPQKYFHEPIIGAGTVKQRI